MGNGTLSSPHFNLRWPNWFGSSLVRRVALMLILVVSLTAMILFAGIEQFVTGQFNSIHEQYLLRRTDEVRQLLDRESTLLLRSIGLAATDSDLIHSVHYHLNLRGDPKPMHEEVSRIVHTFDLLDLEVWTHDDELVFSFSGNSHRLPASVELRHALAGLERGVRLVWHEGDIWAIAVRRLPLSGQSHAVLVSGRPLGSVLATWSPLEGVVNLHPGTPDDRRPDETVRVLIEDLNGAAIPIHINAANPVREALGKTKVLIVASLIVGCMLLLLVITISLRIALRPVASLTLAVEEFGRGRSRVLKKPEGPTELVRLVDAYNQMVNDIQRLRMIEQKAHHDNQLASVGKLAAKLAHDINNPLTVIGNVARLLIKQGNADTRVTDDLQTILKNCERCSNIAANLLRFSRPLRLEFSRCDITLLCRDAAEHSKHRLPGLDIAVRSAPNSEPVFAPVDKFQIGRLLDNLINNAFQACPNEQIVLECGLSDDMAYVAVIDQGKGFSPDAINHLFEPFFSTKPEGTGLGLASCVAIARAHGGDLKVTELDKGQVTLWLPRRAFGEDLGICP